MIEPIGLILAGGSATRLKPVTTVVSKQLLPVYDKPVIYYPLTTLILAGFRKIALISTPNALPNYQYLLGDGSQFGIEINYITQQRPEGLAQAFLLTENLIKDRHSSLILGDNLFQGSMFGKELISFTKTPGATAFAYAVENPSDFGVLEFDQNGKVLSIEEKPKTPKSHWVIPGLYFFDTTVIERAKKIKPSARGELEITDLNLSYLNEGLFTAIKIPRGNAWLDLGTPDGLLDAGDYVRHLQKRQGLPIGSPEEAAWRMKFIDIDQYQKIIDEQSNPHYKKLLLNTLEY